MEALLLKKKEDSRLTDDIVVFDELIQGMINLEFFVPVFTGADKGMRIIPISYLVDNYYFPIRKDIKPRIINYLKGFNNDYLKGIEFYESDEIEIE